MPPSAVELPTEGCVTLELIDCPRDRADPVFEPSSPHQTTLGRIALLGNFLPRRCGIATFTGDVQAALVATFPDIHVDVYAMDDQPGAYAYPDPVVASIPADDPAAYRRTARTINQSGAQVLWLQHEFGIFGGPAGDHLLTLIDALDIPFVATLHTILAAPNPDQRRVMTTLIRRAERLFAMAERGRELLIQVYGARPEQVRVIPHGVPDRPLADNAAIKAKLDLAGRDVLLTFGLLSPGKGIETMIEAMPGIVDRHPRALYVVLGATHPHLVAHEGEAYRERLQALAGRLGVADHVRWIDEFVETQSLLDFIAAADLYVTPYLGAAQMTSGTLAYAVGMGKPVVSTPYVHASELLANGHGTLVDFGDSGAFAAAIVALLDDPAECDRIARANHKLGRQMLWPRLAEASVDEITAVLAEATSRRAARHVPPPRASFAAVARLSDDAGILQHSHYGVPDRVHGYCVDDNARALILMQRAVGLSDALYDRWTPVYAGFVQHAWNLQRRRFRNFMGFDRRWLEDAGSEDSSARALWSLGVTARDGRSEELRCWAADLFDRCASHALELRSLRARAFSSLAATSIRGALPGHVLASQIIDESGSALMQALSEGRRPGWTWFEPCLCYDNARLPEALLRAGAALGRADWIDAGLSALSWLSECQRSEDGDFRPVGNDSFCNPYASPSPFAQQPLEAWATIDACDAAYTVTADRRWIEQARGAYRWFEGENDLGLLIGDAATGECFDGLDRNGVNRNRGAESVLSFQLANAAIRALTDR